MGRKQLRVMKNPPMYGNQITEAEKDEIEQFLNDEYQIENGDYRFTEKELNMIAHYIKVVKDTELTLLEKIGFVGALIGLAICGVIILCLLIMFA